MTSVKSITLSKALTWAFIFSLFLALAYPVLAEESTSPARTHKAIVQNRMEAVREKTASREAEFKARLEKFKDKRKAEITERVNTNLNKINQNQTQQMLKHLEKMTTILNKLGAANASASASIASATAAVSAQALNDYTIPITTEATVRKAAQAARDKLHADLLAVRKLVIEAKKAVSNAIREAKQNGE